MKSIQLKILHTQSKEYHGIRNLIYPYCNKVKLSLDFTEFDK